MSRAKRDNRSEAEMAPDILHTPWGKQMKGARREAKRINDEPRQSLFFCPHSPAYPALEPCQGVAERSEGIIGRRLKAGE
jgi:hypothetical protein